MMMLGKTKGLAALLAITGALLASTVTPAGAVCSNGLEGLQSTSLDVCCPEGCGVCGGIGCTPANTSSLTSADCCATEIVDSGVFCADTGVAPCIITTEPAPDTSVCINGQTGVQDPNTDVCCPLECGTFCGGNGCGSIPGVEASQCCAAAIEASGAVCSDTVAPPCTVVATADNSTTCSNGLAGIEDPIKLICCDAACGQCGGAGCGAIPGLLGTDCCSDEILVGGTLCSVTNAAPCIVDPPEFEPSMCPNGLPGVQDGEVCCAEACNGQCGGFGCGSIIGTNGADDCCSATILETGVPCTDSAPCIMQNGTYTDAPMATPTTAPVALPPGATAAPVAGGALAPGTTAAPVMLATAAPAAGGAGGATTAPVPGERGGSFTSAPTLPGDVNGDGLVNSADTGVVGDTNGDGVVDNSDTGLVGDTNGDGVVNELDEDVTAATSTPTSSPTAAPAGAAGDTIAPTSGDGARIGDDDVGPRGGLTPSPADINGDGVIDSKDEIDINGDGVIDSKDGIDNNGDGVVDENDGDTNGDGVIDSNDGRDFNGDGVIDSADAVDANGDGVVDENDLVVGGSGASSVNFSFSIFAGVVGLAAAVVVL